MMFMFNNLIGLQCCHCIDNKQTQRWVLFQCAAASSLAVDRRNQSSES